MILVDTSVWADHLRRSDDRLAGLLNRGEVLMHGLVLAELALGPIVPRDATIRRLRGMPRLPTADEETFLAFCAIKPVIGRGVGVIDVYLLIATDREDGTILWTRDRRLAETAQDIGVAIQQG